MTNRPLRGVATKGTIPKISNYQTFMKQPLQPYSVIFLFPLSLFQICIFYPNATGYCFKKIQVYTQKEKVENSFNKRYCSILYFLSLISLTAEPIWLSFTVQLLICGPCQVYNYCWEGYRHPPKINRLYNNNIPPPDLKKNYDCRINRRM